MGGAYGSMVRHIMAWNQAENRSRSSLSVVRKSEYGCKESRFDRIEWMNVSKCPLKGIFFCWMHCDASQHMHPICPTRSLEVHKRLKFGRDPLNFLPVCPRAKQMAQELGQSCLNLLLLHTKYDEHCLLDSSTTNRIADQSHQICDIICSH